MSKVTKLSGMNVGSRRRIIRAGSVAASLVLVGSVLTVATTVGATTTKAQKAAAAAKAAKIAWNAVLKGANNEGSLNLYASFGQGVDSKIAAAFEKAYPKITVTLTEGNSSTLEPVVDAQESSGTAGANVIILADQTFLQSRSLVPGYFVRFNQGAKDGPNVNDATGSKLLVDTKNVIQIGSAPIGYAWNTNLVTGTVTQNTLLSSAYQGKVAMLDYTGNNIVLAEDKLLSGTLGTSFFTQFAANQPQFFTSGGAEGAALASGSIAMCIVHPEGLATEIQAGAPIKYAYFSPKTFGVGVYAGIAGWSGHLDASRVFVNWLEGRTAQAIYTNNAVAPVNSAIKVKGNPKITYFSPLQFTSTQLTSEQATLAAIFNHA